MSSYTIQDIVFTTIQMLVIIGVNIFSVKMMTAFRNRLIPIFFTFAMFSYLLSDLYYVVYEILRPDTRMPFAVDEIADLATLLLLAAVLEVLPGIKGKLIPKALIFSILFIGGSIILWIAWSGEWMQDIVFGIPYIYLLYLLLKGLILSKPFTNKEWIVSLSVSTIALLVQLATLCTDGILKKVLEYGCYVLMYVMTGWLFIKVIAELKDKNSNWKSVYLSFTLFLCTLLVLYSSDGLFYSIATVLCTLAVPLMMLSLKKELSLDDIR